MNNNIKVFIDGSQCHFSFCAPNFIEQMKNGIKSFLLKNKYIDENDTIILYHNYTISGKHIFNKLLRYAGEKIFNNLYDFVFIDFSFIKESDFSNYYINCFSKISNKVLILGGDYKNISTFIIQNYIPKEYIKDNLHFDSLSENYDIYYKYFIDLAAFEAKISQINTNSFFSIENINRYEFDQKAKLFTGEILKKNYQNFFIQPNVLNNELFSDYFSVSLPNISINNIYIDYFVDKYCNELEIKIFFNSKLIESINDNQYNNDYLVNRFHIIDMKNKTIDKNDANLIEIRCNRKIIMHNYLYVEKK